MLYTGIIAALSSLDLGIKWLIDREKPENFPKPLPHTKGKILLYRNHNAGFLQKCVLVLTGRKYFQYRA